MTNTHTAARIGPLGVGSALLVTSGYYDERFVNWGPYHPCRFKEMILDCRCPRDPITFAQGGLTISHFGVSVLLFRPLLLNDSAALVMYAMNARQHLVVYTCSQFLLHA